MNEPESRPSLDPAYFDRMYADDPDPWGFATRPYEAAKYAATLAALPRERYRSAFEVGCSIGVLSRLLSDRVDDLLAIDVAEAALEQARRRCADRPHARFERRSFPAEAPDGPFDLILVSEVAYYWSPADLDRARSTLAGRLEPGGHLLMVHWTPFVADYPQTGDAAHEAFLDGGSAVGLIHRGGRRDQTYRVDLFEKAICRPDEGRPGP